MARAGYADVITDGFGNRLAGASVAVRQPGTTLPLGVPLYAGLTGAATLSNPLLADGQGFFAFFLDAPQVVDLHVTAAGHAARTVDGVSVAVGTPLFDGMQVGGATDANARVGVRRNGGGSVYLRRRVNFVEGTGIALAVADDAADEEVDLTIAAAPDTGVVYHDADQTIDSATWTAVALNTNATLAGVAHAGTSNVLVPLASGVWEVEAVVVFAASTAGTVRGVRVLRNGVPLQEVLAPAAYFSPGGGAPIQFFRRVPLLASDGLALEAFQDSGAALTLRGASNINCPYFSLVKIRD